MTKRSKKSSRRAEEQAKPLYCHGCGKLLVKHADPGTDGKYEHDCRHCGATTTRVPEATGGAIGSLIPTTALDNPQ